MISRRLTARLACVPASVKLTSTATAASLRLLSTTLPRRQDRSPSLSDIQPGHVERFDAKQRAFRADLAAKTKKQKEQERLSQSAAAATSPSPPSTTVSATAESPPPSPPSSSSAPASSPNIIHSALSAAGLGSRRTNTGDAARRLDDASDGAPAAGAPRAKGAGRLSSLIYGTEEGRELDRAIERSFSQVLARGKYVHSIVFHEVRPDKVDEYVALVGDWYPRVASVPENKVHLVGSWRTEVGDCDTFVHIWEYQRYEGYHASLHNIQHHPDFAAFDAKLKTLIHSKKTSLMQEFRFWPTSPPRQLGGVFELRSYTLHPGNLLEWETHWQKGLAARREVMEGVGAWFVQIGDLNTVHHLWQFADLEERRARREQSWSVPGWGDTVHKTVPLIQAMKSRIMVPMPWSPIG